MAFVKVRIPRTSQPQDLCGVDRSNWAGNRIIDGFVANSRVTHRGKPITATGPLFAAAYQAGVGLGGNADAGAGFTCDLSAHNGITIVCQYVQYLRSGSQVIFEHSANQNTNAGSFILYSDIAAGKLAFGTSASGNYDSRTVPLPALGEVVTVVLRLRFTSSVDSADDVAIWINGVSPTSTSNSTTAAARNFGNYTTYILGRGGSTLRAHATMGLYEVLAGFASDAECAELSASPWQIFEPEEQWIWVPDAAGAPTDITGDLAATEFGSDTAALSCQIVVQGTLSATETGTDTASIQGGASPVTGTLAATETGTDTSAISGQIVVQGYLAATESGTDTAEIQGGASPVTGSLSATESGADTSAIQGGVVVAGTLAATESGTDTASIAAQLIVQGALAATEAGNDSALINGSSVITTTGTISATESGADGCVSTGTLLVQGLLDAAESGTDTVYAPGQIYVIGALVATETGSDTCAIAGSSPVTITGMLDAVEIGADTCQILQSAITAVYPQPDQVLSGIPYGPTGADYTGTATAGSYPTAADIAAAVRAEIALELARLDATISSRSTVAAIMGATAP